MGWSSKNGIFPNSSPGVERWDLTSPNGVTAPQDYADAASHVSEEAQREAKVPTNSRYFLHDDRRVNEEEKEEKEIFGRGGDGEDFWVEKQDENVCWLVVCAFVHIRAIQHGIFT